tara:strand:- start:9 stop:560 length:552 start_codon:yes stop_codon:yes gene_type:complete
MVSYASLANCPLQQRFGMSKYELKQNFNTSVLAIPGQWGKEDIILYKEDICPNNDQLDNIYALYSFLNDQLIEIKIISKEENSINLIQWVKNEFGAPFHQAEQDRGNIPLTTGNDYFWKMDNMSVMAEYRIYPNEIYQVIRFVSSTHQALFDQYYINVAKGTDPTFKKKMRKYRLKISNLNND